MARLTTDQLKAIHQRHTVSLDVKPEPGQAKRTIGLTKPMLRAAYQLAATELENAMIALRAKLPSAEQRWLDESPDQVYRLFAAASEQLASMPRAITPTPTPAPGPRDTTTTPEERTDGS